MSNQTRGIKRGDAMDKKPLGLSFVWKIRLQLHAEGDKLRAEGAKLQAEGNKLWAEGAKLWAEGNKLWAEGDKLWVEGILAVYGNIKLEWFEWNEELKSYKCKLFLTNGQEEIYG